MCGTAAECIGLSEIDFRKIGDGKTGPVTRAIQKVYHEAIRGKVQSMKVGAITWMRANPSSCRWMPTLP